MDEKKRKFQQYADTMPKKECYLCGDEVPLHMIYSHLRMCLLDYETINNIPHSCTCDRTTRQSPSHPPTQRTSIVATQQTPTTQPPNTPQSPQSQSGIDNDVVYTGQQPYTPFNTSNYWLQTMERTEKKVSQPPLANVPLMANFVKQKTSTSN